MRKTDTTAIVLAAGQGKRMNSKVHKQYLLLDNKPILYYSLHTLEESFVDDIVLVVGKGEQDYCRKEIIEKYGLTKIRAVVEGGKERYHSVANGLQAIGWSCDYVFIHDGARPFLDESILHRAYESAVTDKACAVGMPVKDTVKIADDNGFVESTPPRARVWQIQTPQVFERRLIGEAYRNLIIEEKRMVERGVAITDDAMVVEYFMQTPVRLVEGSYKNIKITTPEDLEVAKIFLKENSY